MDDRMIDDDSCGGFKHCKDRKCDPNMNDCKECIKDSDDAILEIMEAIKKGEL